MIVVVFSYMSHEVGIPSTVDRVVRSLLYGVFHFHGWKFGLNAGKLIFEK